MPGFKRVTEEELLPKSKVYPKIVELLPSDEDCASYRCDVFSDG